MGKINFDDLEYIILPGKPNVESAVQSLHNQAYDKWKALWIKVYSEANAQDAFKVEDFLRQDVIPVIVYKGEVLALHLYSFFDVRYKAVREHRYFSFYPEGFFSYLIENNCPYVMSLEFLTVLEGWRKKDLGISLGEVLISSGLNIMSELSLGAAIAPARTDNKVNTMCYNVGFDCYKESITKRNFNVDLVVGFVNKIKRNENKEIADLADRLWEDRRDYTGLTVKNKSQYKIKVAA